MNINLTIAGHHLHFTDIPSELEQPYRRAGKQLGERFEYYQKQMPRESLDKVWLYVALEAAVNYHSDKRDKAIAPILQRIADLNHRIEQDNITNTPQTC